MRRRRRNATEWSCPDCAKVCRGAHIIALHSSQCKKRRRSSSSTPAADIPTPTAFIVEGDPDDGDDEPNDCYFSNHFRAIAPEAESDSDFEDEEEPIFRQLQAQAVVEVNEQDLGIVSQTDPILSIEDMLQSLEITPLQRQAARYIVTSGKSDCGLSVKSTTAYIQSLRLGAEVRQLWPSGRTFW